MPTYALKLEIETDELRPFGPKQAAVIERLLNAQYLDATFKLSPALADFITSDGKLVDNSATAKLNDWERQALEHMAVKVLEPNGDPHLRVKINRLRLKLPDTHKIMAKRNCGYRLVKA
tara:strand:+ start:39 stop:395 length:357 start_codon:yes stop_codon:yes gene_type:complete